MFELLKAVNRSKKILCACLCCENSCSGENPKRFFLTIIAVRLYLTALSGITLLAGIITMGPKQRREREKESLRQEILDAARELFVKEGYENVSMRRIAEKIEYSPTTIYLYFDDKASLLLAICEETFAKLAKKLETIAREQDDAVEALKEGCRAYIQFGLKYPNHYRVTFINPPDLGLGPEHFMRDDSMGMRAYNALRGVVEECVRQNRMRESDVDALSQAIWAANHGITSLLITKPHFPWANRNRLVDLTITTFIGGLLK